MWAHPYVSSVGLIFLVRRLFFLWMLAASFLSVCLVWAIVPLIRGVTGVVMTRACTRWLAGPPLCSVVVTAA